MMDAFMVIITVFIFLLIAANAYLIDRLRKEINLLREWVKLLSAQVNDLRERNDAMRSFNEGARAAERWMANNIPGDEFNEKTRGL